MEKDITKLMKSNLSQLILVEGDILTVYRNSEVLHQYKMTRFLGKLRARPITGAGYWTIPDILEETEEEIKKRKKYNHRHKEDVRIKKLPIPTYKFTTGRNPLPVKRVSNGQGSWNVLVDETS
jgi:hypothetical protein